MHTLGKYGFTLGFFAYGDPKDKVKAHNVNVAILREIESGRYSCTARPLGLDGFADGFEPSIFMQGNIDVHGSHGLFTGRGVASKG